jgi:hypothetical protein
MAGHLFLDMLTNMALGIVEMKMQLATADIPQLISQWKNCVTDEIYRCDGRVLWQ